MATAVIMPRQGQSVESCIIGKWHKRAGDAVSAGDALFTYETDKATFDELARESGVLLEIFFEEGDDVPCLTNVCVIGKPGEDVSQFRPAGAAPAQPAAAAGHDAFAVLPSAKPALRAASRSEVQDIAPQPVQNAAGDFIKISPRARLFAERSGADIALAQPTGANGRIMERDVRKALEAGRVGTGIGGRVTAADIANAAAPPSIPTPPPVSDYEDVKPTNIRKIIAASMHASLMNTAQLTLNSSFDATDITEFRRRVKAAGEGMNLPNVTVTDIIVYATAKVLMKYRNMNSYFLDDKIRLFNTVNMGVAADTPKGLMVPTVFGADKLTLAELSAAVRDVVGRCRTGSVSPDLLKDGTFTVSNLGMMGIESFTPVLNPPQTGILGVCSAIERVKNGRAYQAIGLSLTFDHRALDGADAARFLKELVERLENFSLTAALGV